LAASLRILYGGGITPTNSRQFFALPDIDGGLVGRCSLESEDFSKICRIACQPDIS
jgi:triosephosphate isomerase (TIM)